MVTFRERINQLYEEEKDSNHKLTQEDFATKVQATRNQLKGWLDGRGEPNCETLKRIAKTYKVSVSWLVGETNIRHLPVSSDTQKIMDTANDLPLEALRKLEEFRDFLKSKYISESH